MDSIRRRVVSPQSLFARLFFFKAVLGFKTCTAPDAFRRGDSYYDNYYKQSVLEKDSGSM